MTANLDLFLVGANAALRTEEAVRRRVEALRSNFAELRRLSANDPELFAQGLYAAFHSQNAVRLASAYRGMANLAGDGTSDGLVSSNLVDSAPFFRECGKNPGVAAATPRRVPATTMRPGTV